MNKIVSIIENQNIISFLLLFNSNINILESFEKIKEYDIALLAPTGRSAKRMSESVGVNASTIHKFLKWNKETETFGLDEYNKAGEKIVIVDESSMIDIFLFSSLFCF